ncbi:hypothetical protein G3A39_39210 [Paraburkholderia aspalathi]|nr:hypothetical protein [Paraburkholderia aspalathi]
MHSCLVSIVSLLGLIAGAAYADTPPKRSKNFSGNYETLVKDQKVKPQIAECIATGRDLVANSRIYDRLGFTSEDIAAAKNIDKAQKYSAADATKVSTTIAVSGEARLRNGSSWDRINLHCGISGGKIKAISLTKTK